MRPNRNPKKKWSYLDWQSQRSTLATSDQYEDVVQPDFNESIPIVPSRRLKNSKNTASSYNGSDWNGTSSNPWNDVSYTSTSSWESEEVEQPTSTWATTEETVVEEPPVETQISPIQKPQPQQQRRQRRNNNNNKNNNAEITKASTALNNDVWGSPASSSSTEWPQFNIQAQSWNENYVDTTYGSTPVNEDKEYNEKMIAQQKLAQEVALKAQREQEEQERAERQAQEEKERSRFAYINSSLSSGDIQYGVPIFSDSNSSGSVSKYDVPGASSSSSISYSFDLSSPTSTNSASKYDVPGASSSSASINYSFNINPTASKEIKYSLEDNTSKGRVAYSIEDSSSSEKVNYSFVSIPSPPSTRKNKYSLDTTPLPTASNNNYYSFEINHSQPIKYGMDDNSSTPSYSFTLPIEKSRGDKRNVPQEDNNKELSFDELANLLAETSYATFSVPNDEDYRRESNSDDFSRDSRDRRDRYGDRDGGDRYGDRDSSDRHDDGRGYGDRDGYNDRDGDRRDSFGGDRYGNRDREDRDRGDRYGGDRYGGDRGDRGDRDRDRGYSYGGDRDRDRDRDRGDRDRNRGDRDRGDRITPPSFSRNRKPDEGNWSKPAATSSTATISAKAAAAADKKLVNAQEIKGLYTAAELKRRAKYEARAPKRAAYRAKIRAERHASENV